MTSLNLLGQTIDGFEILSELGRGGMAVVYRARQQMPSRYVALKVLPPEFGRDASYIARFRQEADSAAALEHPHIVPIYAFGSSESLHYIAMKLVSGRTLKSLIDVQGAMRLEDTIVVLEQIADALDYAHRNGVIHRDIKPSNVMMDDGGWVYLTDFGLARGQTSSLLTQTGTVMGTPAYMSPEQAEGRTNIGPASDLYSLGVIIYEMLTGQMPFEAETSQGVLVARLYQPPRPPRQLRPELSPEVEAIILRALGRQPEDRFPSARDLVSALRDAERAEDSAPPAAAEYAPAPVVETGPTMAMPLTRPVAPKPTPLPTPPVGLPHAAPPHGGRTRHAPPHAVPSTGPTMALPSMGDTIAVGQRPGHHERAARPKRSWRGCLVGCAIAGVLMLAGAAGGAYLVYTYGVQISQADDARRALANSGDMKASIAALEQLQAAHPDLDEAKEYLALTYLLSGRNADAVRLAEPLAEKGMYPPLGGVVLAMAKAERGEYESAMETIDQAIDHDSGYALAYAVRASINADRGATSFDRDLLSKAAHDLDQANVKLSSEDSLDRALISAAAAHVHRQSYEVSDDRAELAKAAEALEQAVKLQPKLAYFHTELGYIYSAQGEHDKARQAFQEALGADPGYVHAQVGLGWNAYYTKDYEEAVRLFDKALQMRSDDADAHLGKSYALADLSTPDYQGAVAEARLAAGLAPDRLDVQSELGWAYRNLGSSLSDNAARKDQYTQAEQQFRRVLEKNDRFFDAQLGLGWALQDLALLIGDDAKLRASLDTLDRALELKKNQPYALNARGWTNYHLNEYDDALDDFNQALERDAQYGDALLGKGRTLVALEKPDEAKVALQAAVDAGSTTAQYDLDELK